MRKRFNFSISILLVLSLVFCNITVVLADETIQPGTEWTDEEAQDSNVLPDGGESPEPGALQDTDEGREPEVLPDAEETEEPEALPDGGEKLEPGAVQDADESREPEVSPDAVETQKPGTLPEAGENENSVRTEEPQIITDGEKAGLGEDSGKEHVGNTYTVYYEYNAPSPSFGFPTEKKYAQAGSTVEVAFEPMISGYEFIGWETTDVDGTGILFQNGGSFIMPENDVTLTGVWKDLSKKEFTVTYILNPEYTDMYDLSNAGGRILGDGKSYSEQKNIKDKITAFGVVVTEKGQKTADKHVEMSMESDVRGQKGEQQITYYAGTVISVWDGQNAKVSYSGEIPFGFTNFAEGTEVRIMVTPGAEKPQPQSYTVKFLNQNGEELTNLTRIAEAGSSLDTPSSLENYYTLEENSRIQVFDQWLPQSEAYTLENLSSITQDMTFKASYKDAAAKWFIRYNGSCSASVKELVVKDIKPINPDGSMEPETMEEIHSRITANAYNPAEVPVLTQEIFDGFAESNQELKDAGWENYKIVWHVFKESNDGYYADGVLVKKQEDNNGEDSGTPENPINPDSPEVPPVPENPINPDSPEVPPVPENPINPDSPEVPPVPENPINPDSPETPPVPENPANPGSPERPSAPGNSSGPSASDEETDINDDEIGQAPENAGEIDIEEDEIPQAPGDAEEIDIEDDEIPGGPSADNEKAEVPEGETEIPEDEIPKAPAALLPQTGTASVFLFYGAGLLLMAWGVLYFRRRKA